ncbi:AAC-rich mRNA clone AAC11 protein isoform X2 [Bicyclus anynana]|uniref:AAC-rich mRNA clone AAC11 protein isoform X2 n=1 Tax=Bicyclus anynana TaxID=110368 RepID=A0A6J1ND95_BICAN|nr:AAC-rich mRNA clone AAC11 protein isoform X2 [Bicyclus anynana]
MAENLESISNKNNELVKAVQHWKMVAAQKDNENLQLKKEVTDLRFKLSRLQITKADFFRKLNSSMQTQSEEALSLLVQTSDSVAKMWKLVKDFTLAIQETESTLPRWSSLSKSPRSTPGKVQKVKPMMGGTHLQPVVALHRNERMSTPRTRTTNRMSTGGRRPPLVHPMQDQSNENIPASAVPLHMLQDQPNASIPARAVPLHMLQVYVPLTRIDARRPADVASPSGGAEPGADAEEDEDNSGNGSNSAPDSASDAGSEGSNGSASDQEELDSDSHMEATPAAGASWRLDVSSVDVDNSNTNNLGTPTTVSDNEPMPGPSQLNLQVQIPESPVCEFTPTVRRRKRTVALSPRPSPRSPHASPRPAPRPARRLSKEGRILKVMVAKLRLDDNGDATSPKRRNLTETQPRRPKPTEAKRPNPTEAPRRLNSTESQQKLHRPSQDSPMLFASPPILSKSPILQLRDRTPTQRLMRFDAPSPNGSTDSRVQVINTTMDQPEPCCSGTARSRTISRSNSRENRKNSNNHTNHGHHSNNNGNHGHHNSSHDNQQDVPTIHITQANRDSHRTNPTSQPNCDKDNHSITPNHNQNNQGPSTSSHSNHDNSSIRTKRPNTSNDNQMPSTSSFNYVNESRNSRRSRLNSHNDVDSDSSNSDAISETRSRRARKAVVYKEKPLNRKMRR